MKRKHLCHTIVLGLVALLGTAADASYYRIYGRANAQIFFGPSQDFFDDQINGAKSYQAEATGQNFTDYAVGRIDVRFGSHKGFCLAQGLFSNSYAEARTEEDITFVSGNGAPVTVRVNLVGTAVLGRPATVSTQLAQSTLSIGGVPRVSYLDKYIGNSHEVRPAVPYEFQVLSGTTLRFYHRSVFQISGTANSSLYFVSCNAGIQAEIKVMTPGAKMMSSTGARYVPLTPRNP